VYINPLLLHSLIHSLTMTIYTHKIDWVADNNRLPFVGETVTIKKSLGWANSDDKVKTIVCYSKSDLVPHTLSKGNTDYCYFTVDIVNNNTNKFTVVKVHNQGYSDLMPGMKSQEVLSQFL
jgi:hypothetical protein